MSARALLLSLLAAAPAAAQEHTVRGKVVDADGKPVAGAAVANYWIAGPDGVQPHNPATSAADGGFAVTVPGWMPEAGLLAYTPDRTRVGLALVDPKAAAPATITLGPAVTVSGRFDCTELGRRPKWTNVYMNAGPKNARLIQCSSDTAEFALPLPPGDYQFWGYGQDVVGTKRPVTVPAGKPGLDLGTLDLKATAVAKMTGKPPLPWHVKDARGLPQTVQIGDLKGKWVLLDFWGHWCGPCVQNLAELIDLCELYADHRDKFEIIAFHDSTADDLADVDKKTATTKRSVWGGRDLPFPILLDDGGKTVKVYTIQSFPTVILIDPDGNVVGEDRAHAVLESKLPKLPPAVKAARALNTMVGIEMEDTGSLASTVKFLERMAGVPVTLDAAAVKAKGIDPAAKVTLKMTGQVSLRSWFELLLSGTGLVAQVAGDGLTVTAGDPPAASKAQAACADHLRGVLAKPLAFELPATTLGGLCQFFETKTRENFVLDPAARRAGTLDPAKPVPAATGDGKPLTESLKAILDPLGLEAVVRCEVVVIRPKG